MDNKSVAEFMISEKGYIVQEKFGEEFVYENGNGNLAISKKVLNEFKEDNGIKVGLRINGIISRIPSFFMGRIDKLFFYHSCWFDNRFYLKKKDESTRVAGVILEKRVNAQHEIHHKSLRCSCVKKAYGKL